MKRTRIILTAIMLSTFGAVVPLIIAYYISWGLAIKAEQERMAFFSNLVLERANISFGEAKETLHRVADSNLKPCSHEHIAGMRTLTLNTRSVEEIGYFENNTLKCTSWGIAESRIIQSPPDYVTSDGIGVTARMKPVVGRGKYMTALQYKFYNVLVNPARFVDVIADPSVSLAIVSRKGDILTYNRTLDRDLLKSIVRQPRSGTSQTSIFAIANAGDWLAIASAPRTSIQRDLRRQQMLLLPIGIFIALFIIGLVVWQSRKRLSPLGELTNAVQNREFIVYYQPIIELKTGFCVGAEALVRWRRPDGSLVRPDLFIPLAEESGLIRPITDQVIETAIYELNELLVADHSLHVAINLCAEDIKTGRVLETIEKVLKDTRVHPQQIWLEVTERGFVDIEPARVTIDRARQLGYSISIDDFGTGYSSLQYLQDLPMDALKIDKSFVDTIGKDAATSSVVPHIIEMAKTLNLYIIAEGVDNSDQVEYLRSNQVEYCQGWFFSKALPASEFVAFYRRRKET